MLSELPRPLVYTSIVHWFLILSSETLTAFLSANSLFWKSFLSDTSVLECALNLSIDDQAKPFGPCSVEMFTETFIFAPYLSVIFGVIILK